MFLRIAKKINILRFKNLFILIQLANKNKIKLLGFTKYYYIITGIKKIIKAYVVPDNISYLILLNRF